MSPRANPMPASASGMAGAPGCDIAYRANGYEPVSIGLIILAVDDPARADGWHSLPALLDLLFHEGIACVVTTSATRRKLVDWLERLGCATRLPMRISTEDMAPEAPFPNMTLLACNRLAIPARHAVVIADGPRGTVGGAAAGCTVVALGNAANQAALRRTGAHLGIDHPGALAPLLSDGGSLECAWLRTTQSPR